MSARAAAQPDRGRISAVAKIARAGDPERFLCALLSPPECREDLFTLLAFNQEIARTRSVVSEAMLGQIRLQWWRDVLAEAADGHVRRHEVAEPLAATLRKRPQLRPVLDRMIDGREADLDDAAPPDLPALHAYAGATGGHLGEAMLLALWPETATEPPPQALTAARAAGTAYALAGILRATVAMAREGRVLLPADRLGAEGEQLLRDLKPSAALAAAGAAVRAHAAQDLAVVAEARTAVPRPARAALLPARIARQHLARIKRCDDRLLDPRLAMPLPLLPISLTLAALTGRY